MEETLPNSKKKLRKAGNGSKVVFNSALYSAGDYERLGKGIQSRAVESLTEPSFAAIFNDCCIVQVFDVSPAKRSYFLLKNTISTALV